MRSDVERPPIGAAECTVRRRAWDGDALQATETGVEDGLDAGLSLAAATEDFRRTTIRHALEAAGGNQSAAAELSGLPRSNLSRLMKRLGLR